MDFTVKDKFLDKVIPCPKCKNRQKFKLRSCRGGEDTEDMFLECGKCGYDPTRYNSLHRIEQVYATFDADTARFALENTWNELLTKPTEEE